MPPRRRNKVWVHASERTPEMEGSDLEMVSDREEVVQPNHKEKKKDIPRAVEPAPLEPPPPFDPKTFKHQPITAAHHQKMKAVSDSWDTPKVPLDSLAQLIRESAALLTEVADDADPTTLRSLDKAMREVVDMQNELDVRKNSAMGLRENLTRGGILVDPIVEWEKNAQDGIEKYQKQTTRQKYANDKTYRDYREEIWGVKHEGGMPPLKAMIPREEGDDESDDDDEVEIGGMVVTYRDPLTKAWLDDPVTSKKCHHSYSRGSIMEYLRPANAPKKCPATGCGEMVSRGDLETDENLARQTRNAKRKEEEQDRVKKGRRGTTVVDDSDDDIVE